MAAEKERAKQSAGGSGVDASDLHLCHRFTNSAGRTLCASLDPGGVLGQTSNLLIRHLSGDHLVLVDAPCGGGPAALSFIDVLCELRAQGLLPTLPIRIQLLAGDFSERSRDHFNTLLGLMSPEWAKRGIRVYADVFHWDLSDANSNAEFVDRVVAAAQHNVPVLAIAANFNDALSDRILREAYEHFISQLVGRLRDYPYSLCWIEPISNKARRFLDPLLDFVKRFLPFLRSEQIPPFEAQFGMTDLLDGAQFRSGVLVKVLEAGRTA